MLDSSGFAAGMQKATSKTKAFSQQMFRAGRDLSAALTLPLALAAKSAVETASGFELAQAKIAALSGASKPFADLAATARELGSTTIFTAEEVSQLQLNLKKLGKTKNEIKGIQEPILQFAQALDYGIAESGEFVVQTLNRFKESLKEVGGLTEQAAYVTNVFAAAAANSAVDAEKLRSALNYVGSEASAAGFSLEETTALIGLLADRGFDASRGGTALRRILAELAKDGFSAAETIDALLDSSQGYRAELEQFGLRGGGPAAAIGGLRAEFELLLDTLKNSDGFTESVADTLDSTLYAAFRRVTSAAQEASIAFSLEFAPTIKNIANNLADFFRRLSEIPKPLKAVVVSVGFLVAAIGPALLAVGALGLAFTTLSTIILANPIIAAAAAIIGIGTALSLTKTPLDQNVQASQRLTKALAEQYGVGLDVIRQTKLTNSQMRDAITAKIRIASLDKQIAKAQESLTKTNNPRRIALLNQRIAESIDKRNQEEKAIQGVADAIDKVLDKQVASDRKSSFIGFFPTEITAEEKARLRAAAEERAKVAADAARKALGDRLGYNDFDIDPLEDLNEMFGRVDKDRDNIVQRGTERLESYWNDIESQFVDKLEPIELPEDIIDDEFELLTPVQVEAAIERFEFMKNYVEIWGERLRAVAINVGQAFSDFFFDGIEQSKTWAESFKENILDALNSVLRKVVALIIAFGILSLVSGGLFGEGLAKVASGALKGQNLGQFVGAGLGFFQPDQRGAQAVTVNGSLAGTDIVLTNQRAGTALDRIYG